MRKLIPVTFFATAFGYLEAAVVVYLRALYYPEGFFIPFKVGFPFIYFAIKPIESLATIPMSIYLIEIGREFSTIIMLLATAWIVGKNLKEKFCYFLWAFGVWDIFYYVFLKILLGWPKSLTETDVYFLIPVPWLGPVWFPIFCSLTIMTASAIMLSRKNS